MRTSSPTKVDWTLPDPKRRDAFFEFKTNHTHLTTAFRTIMQLVNTPDSGRLGIGVGPTGAGKTTLIRSARRKIEIELGEELANDLSRIPSIVVTACPSENHAFNWRQFYLRVLEGCREVSSKHKVPIEFLDGTPLYKRMSRDDTAAGLREAVCEVFRQRRPRALFVDEAQHILKAGSGEHLQGQLDVLKTLADECGIPIILFGTYSLLVQHTMNGQLARRSTTIHFPRYRFDNPEDQASFARVVATLEERIPTKVRPNLLASRTLLFERSLGCIGILKETLVRAVNLAIETRSETVTEQHLRDSFLDARKCEAIAREILEGERLFSQEEERRASERLRDILRMENDPRPVSSKKPSSSSRKPGVRKPTRDSVGRPLS